MELDYMNSLLKQNQNRMLLLGIVGPLVSLLCIALAIPLSPWFTWFGNALSDLGNYNNGFAVAILFNSGLIISGLSCFLFTIWFLTKTRSIALRFGMIVFAISNVFLILIGIFSENAGSIHFTVSVGFFATFPFAMWIAAADFLRFKETRLYSIPSIVLPFASIYLWYITFTDSAPWTGVAIPEIVTALTAILWLYLLCAMIRWDILPKNVWNET
ncbi:DUF998 domain-containing protein [Candidatus Thorarchaeota archaeon]|jgi:hypothetical membrane protein|nr:MAG: DUF998 domain-containing protein [Candidatus Thorarchaeota archaeon]